jgi:hypothetical protein
MIVSPGGEHLRPARHHLTREVKPWQRPDFSSIARIIWARDWLGMSANKACTEWIVPLPRSGVADEVYPNSRLGYRSPRECIKVVSRAAASGLT